MPTFQAHVVYLHAVQMTWLRISMCQKHSAFSRIKSLRPPSGTRTVSSYTPGTSSQLGSYRKNEQALTAEPTGFGRSSGRPTEGGLIQDALAVTDWAMNVAGVPAARILIFSQSMGTAASIVVSNHFAAQSPPTAFAGIVLVAPLVNVPTLVSTYSVAGTIPILSLLARFPAVFPYLLRFIKDKWLTNERISQFVRINEVNGERYRLTIILAEDDRDIPSHHTQTLFWHAVNGSMPDGMAADELVQEVGISSGPWGSTVMKWWTDNGVIREELLKTGLYDVIVAIQSSLWL